MQFWRFVICYKYSCKAPWWWS